MKTVKAALSANSGISLTLPGGRIFLDAISKSHNEFSQVTPEIWDYMKKSEDFSSPDVICFSHVHADHYSYKMTAEAKQLWPEAKIILQDFDFDDQIVLAGEQVDYSFSDISMKFVKTVHSGKGFEKENHYSIVIREEDLCILFSGDVTMPTEEIKTLIEKEKPQILILPFLWATQKNAVDYLLGLDFVKSAAIVHIPFAEDDQYGYRRAVEKNEKIWSVLPDIRIMDDPYQVEEFFI